jgi:phospholipid/cholesterol/gamma-HCH transport system substrate-binding protein
MKLDKELAAGFFLLLGILSLVYISVKLGRLEVIGGKGYSLYAEFEKAGGIKPGAIVEIAGVKVGRIKSIRLVNYQALVEFTVSKDIEIQEDAIASIKTKGLIGEKYLQITPGGSDIILQHGGKIRETESAIDIEEIIAKYVFGKV